MKPLPGSNRLARRRSRRGAILFAYLVIGGAIAAFGISIALDAVVSATHTRAQATILQEGALLREFAEAATAQAVLHQAAIEEAFATRINAGDLAGAAQERRTTVATPVSLDRLSLISSGRLRASFPATLPSGGIVSARLGQRPGSAVQDLLIFTSGGMNASRLFGERGSLERATAARQRMVEAIGRDPPSLPGSTDQGIVVGLINPGSSVIAIQGGPPQQVTHMLAPSAVPATFDAPPEAAILVKAPGQWGHWLLTVSTQTRTAPLECRGGATGSLPLFRCHAGQDRASEFCSIDEDRCLRADTASPGSYDSCVASLRVSDPSIPASRDHFCSPIAACSTSEVDAILSASIVDPSRRAECLVASPLPCDDGEPRRISLLQAEPSIANNGFAASCPDGAVPLARTDLTAARRSWSTLQDASSMVTFCVPAFRHGVQPTLSAGLQASSSNYPWNAIPLTAHYLAGDVLAAIDSLPAAGGNITADWGQVVSGSGTSTLANDVYARQAIDACVGPGGEMPAAGTGPTELNRPLPNVVASRRIEVPDVESNGSFVLYALTARILTDARAAGDPRSVRLFDDWSLPGAGAIASDDAFRGARASMYAGFSNNLRANGYAEFGAAFMPSGAPGGISVDIPYNPAGTPSLPFSAGPGCPAVFDQNGAALARAFRTDGPVAPCSPARLGPAWRVVIEP